MNVKGLNKYDAIIIGAGVGGLVCACYLIKSGLKILVLEQNDKPGGCCASLELGAYKFDVGVHYFGSLKKGILGKILDELEITSLLKVLQFDPVERIITPDGDICLRSNSAQTINEFRNKFPRQEKNIKRFFDFISQENFFLSIYPKIKKMTFRNVLDEFFEDEKLKAIFNAISIWNIGAHADKSLALACIAMFREYVMDPGYYPYGGSQAYPNLLTQFIRAGGGEVKLNARATQILNDNNSVCGVELENGEHYYADIVVTNADANETFSSFLNVKTDELDKINYLVRSPSMFVVYAGLNIDLRLALNNTANILYFSNYNIDETMFDTKKIFKKDDLHYLMLSFPSLHDPEQCYNSRTSVGFYIFANYESPEFWLNNKDRIAELIVDLADKIIPNLRNSIEKKFVATPITFEKFTLNAKGACLGWLPDFEKTKLYKIKQRCSIRGLYAAGHWYTGEFVPSGGIPVVSFSGRRAARIILDDLGKQWKYKEIGL